MVRQAQLILLLFYYRLSFLVDKMVRVGILNVTSASNFLMETALI